MIENFPFHYSMANPATVYDEESLTVLELCARLSGKLRELIAEHNDVSKQSGQNANQLNALFDMVDRLVVQPLGYATPQMFGAVGDGVADDTASVKRAIQALDKYAPVLHFPVGVYLINEDLVIPSNVNITGCRGSVIKRAPNSLTHYAILDLEYVENVTIEGITVQGDVGTHTGTTGEWGMGISVCGCENIIIRDVHATLCWGDGIYIGNAGDEPCVNVTVDGCTVDKNRRNNISVIYADGVRIVNCDISEASGTAPQAGIDFEPNYDYEDVVGVQVSNCRFHGNTGSDILIADGTEAHGFEITISDCEMHSKVGFEYSGNLANARTQSDIVVRNCNFNNSFRCVHANHGSLTNRLIFQACTFASTVICIEMGSSDFESTGNMGNVHFWGCNVLNNGNYPIYRILNKNGTCSNITGELNVLYSTTRYSVVTVNDYNASSISLCLKNAPTKATGNLTVNASGMLNEVYIPDGVGTDPEIDIGANWPNDARLTVYNYSTDMFATVNHGGGTHEVNSNRVGVFVKKNGVWCATV